MPVLREEQGHKLRMHLLVSSEVAAQEAGNQLAVDRRVIAWEVYVLKRLRQCFEILPQFPDLRRFARTVEPFYYYKHLFLIKLVPHC